MKIGVFDSGVGGEAIAKVLRKNLKNVKIVVINDKKNLPYGDKTKKQIINLTETAIQPLLDDTCDIVIIACNTATALAIEYLREKYPSQKFIGTEPMIKSAAEITKTNTIGVCATPATLKSARYKKLKQKYGSHLKIIQPDCSQWAKMIESHNVNRRVISDTINQLCDKNADVIVLGCTHYKWIEKLIKRISKNRARIIEPSQAILDRAKQLLKLG